eukprot:s383_g28.t2
MKWLTECRLKPLTGLSTLFVHDSSDIIVDLLKMVNYLGYDSKSGLFLAEGFFAVNLVTWFLMRTYFFILKVIRSTIPKDYFAPGWGPAALETENK